MKFSFLLIGGATTLGGLFATAVWASRTGAGITPPSKQVFSIREGSVRPVGKSRRARTRYFVGGGIHGGK